jgi:putative ABC transport system substrate-binding protein
MALASQIIAKFANAETDVVVTIGTMPSQCALKLAKEKKIKLIFSSVTNPSDISENLKDSNVTGVSNFVDLDPQVKLFKKLQPSLKTLGVVYNTGEANSISIVKKLRDICKNNGIQLAEQGISAISDVPQATSKLLESSDAIFISNDNMALSGISNIIKICNKKKIPVYVSDTDQVEKGCLAALGPNQFEIGVQTGKIIKRVADGEDINNVLVEYPDTSELYINLDAAKLLGIQISDDVKSKAKKIIGG